MENVYKFVKWDAPSLETLKESNAYKIMEKLNNGEKLTRAEKDYFSFMDGCYVKNYGWYFNFAPYCKRYLVKIKYYGWQEIYHFDKTAIRKNNSGIIEIIEA